MPPSDRGKNSFESQQLIMNYYIGISANYHDSSVSIIDDHQILFAGQLERLTRVKNDSSHPSILISEAIKFLNIDPKYIKAVGFYENEYKKRLRSLLTPTFSRPKSSQEFKKYLSRCKRNFTNIRIIRRYF